MCIELERRVTARRIESKEGCMKRIVTLICSLFLAGLVSTPASADPIGPDCSTCNGGIYTLFTDFVDTNPDLLLTTFRVSFLADTSGVAAVVPAALAIDSVSIKIANGTTVATLVSFPPNSGDWGAVEIDSGINNDGCSGSGNGFICTQSTTNPAEIGGILEWIFDVTFTGSLNAGSEVKARFVDDEGGHVGDLLSENITLQRSPCVPGTPGCRPPFLIVAEPSSLALLGLAILAAGALTRRRGIG
jgi:hypothetical protein